MQSNLHCVTGLQISLHKHIFLDTVKDTMQTPKMYTLAPDENPMMQSRWGGGTRGRLERREAKASEKTRVMLKTRNVYETCKLRAWWGMEGLVQIL